MIEAEVASIPLQEIAITFIREVASIKNIFLSESTCDPSNYTSEVLFLLDMALGDHFIFTNGSIYGSTWSFYGDLFKGCHSGDS